jgi:hypothetical protein
MQQVAILLLSPQSSQGRHIVYDKKLENAKVGWPEMPRYS